MTKYRGLCKYLTHGKILLLAAVCLIVGGCSGLHIHQPGDFENAKSAQTHFNNAKLKETVTTERKRLATVLETELELVKRHTLARRDARLVYIIGEGESQKTWEFLEKDISDQIQDLGFTMEEFEQNIGNLSQLPVRVKDLAFELQGWERKRNKNPNLPILTCSSKSGVPADSATLDVNLSQLETINYNDFKEACGEYLKLVVKTGDEAKIAEIKAAKAEAENKIKEAKKLYKEARKEYATALNKQQASESDITNAATAYKEKIEAFENLGDALENSDKFKKAEGAFKALDLNLSGIMDDLKASTEIARLEVAREQILAMLSAVVNADSEFKEDVQAPANTNEIIGVLATVGKALEKSRKGVTVHSLQIEAELLKTDITAAERRKAFFDKTLALLEEAQKAKIQEMLYLARMEQLRRQIDGKKDKSGNKIQKGCLDSSKVNKGIARVFESSSGVDERCREKVFKLLVAYSNVWTFGRVPQEQIDYRLIALHHDAALDVSELAFERWNTLLGVPIGQLVDLHATGIKPEDIATMINALGLGAIAIGVN